MADGTGQHSFNMPPPQTGRLRAGEIVVDLFAGGGGASTGIRIALGRDPDIAINHDALAIGMHAANHPFTQHLQEDIWHADPVREVGARLVGWMHASPDCTHFSQAKGGQPRDRATRSLSWVILKWAGKLRRVGRAPRVISMENVKQILQWGPLIAKRDPTTGRVIKLGPDGKPCGIAMQGERVPLREQWLIPDPKHAGRTWNAFVAALRALGYAVEWERLVASQYGAGTQRDRLFVCARRDGEPIRWPAPKFAKKRSESKKSGLPAPRSAADCIDWSIPGRSIFDRPRPLAEKTLVRIAKGVKRFVIDAPDPFIVEGYRILGVHCESGELRTPAATAAEHELCARALAPFLTEHANGSNQRNMPADDPLVTICAAVKGGHLGVVTPVLLQAAHGEGAGATKRRGEGTHDILDPIGTIHAGAGSFALIAPHLVKFRGESSGSAANDPMPTITSGAGAARPAGCAHAMGVVSAVIVPNNTNNAPHSVDDPVPTITTCAGRNLLTTAFLERANGGFYDGAGEDMRDPAPTICAEGSHARLVTAHIQPMQQHSPGADAHDPLGAVLAGGTHHAVVECELAPEVEAGALRVAAFMINYYGNGQPLDVEDPAATITTKDRLALVTVWLHGEPYVIVDIRLRMLEPHELYRAQGFLADYIIDRTADGRKLSKSAQVRMVGNSVSPPPMAALVEVNLDPIPMALAA